MLLFLHIMSKLNLSSKSRTAILWLSPVWNHVSVMIARSNSFSSKQSAKPSIFGANNLAFPLINLNAVCFTLSSSSILPSSFISLHALLLDLLSFELSQPRFSYSSSPDVTSTSDIPIIFSISASEQDLDLLLPERARFACFGSIVFHSPSVVDMSMTKSNDLSSSLTDSSASVVTPSPLSWQNWSGGGRGRLFSGQLLLVHASFLRAISPHLFVQPIQKHFISDIPRPPGRSVCLVFSFWLRSSGRPRYFEF